MGPSRNRLRIPHDQLDAINGVLVDPDSQVIQALLDVVAKYGTAEEINRRASHAREELLRLDRLRSMDSPYVRDLEWLRAQRDAGAFVPLSEYRSSAMRERTDRGALDPHFAVTLEISACQYFPWLVAEAKQAIDRRELMPARYIRVRKMKEQELDQGDILTFAAAMQIIGASYVETLDTRGTDGSNVHLGGPETITGYFGGVGQPNDYPLKWVDEYLYYYTEYGIDQVLNVNPGTVLLGYLLYKLGVDISFKISVFMGNDNPYSILWTLMTAKLLARKDGTTPLVGFNFANSVNNATILLSAEIRRAFGLEDLVRFEHHVTETWKHIVRQPYNRRDELPEIYTKVANISAKHEGGDPEVERQRDHPSDILEYFVSKAELEAQGLMPSLLRNYLDKHDAVNATARSLLEHGVDVVPASRLHLTQ